MQFYSSTDNLLNNISNNTYNLDKGDFPSLVGLVFRHSGASINALEASDEEGLRAANAYIWQDTYFSLQEMCTFLAVPATNGVHVIDLSGENFKQLLYNITGKYLLITGGSAAWMRIKKFECNYTVTASGTIPATTHVIYKMIVDIYNQN
jgi:hypothetical protein